MARLFPNTDKLLSEFNVDFLARFFTAGLPANRRAAAVAVLKAKSMPGSLIRITCTDIDQIAEVWAVAEYVCKNEEWLDEAKTRKTLTPEGRACLELKNGSGIIIDLEVVLSDGRKVSTADDKRKVAP
jgi:hypothetical protein